MDFKNPNGAKVTLAVIRHPATDKENYKGPVIFNSGVSHMLKLRTIRSTNLFPSNIYRQIFSGRGSNFLNRDRITPVWIGFVTGPTISMML
jgi:hypothetical protein